jgi:hypothetical protein
MLKMKAEDFNKALGWPDIPGNSNLHHWEQDAEENTWTGKRESNRKMLKMV